MRARRHEKGGLSFGLSFDCAGCALTHWPQNGLALDGDDDGGVVWGGEDVLAEAVCVWVPAEWVALYKAYQELLVTA